MDQFDQFGNPINPGDPINPAPNISLFFLISRIDFPLSSVSVDTSFWSLPLPQLGLAALPRGDCAESHTKDWDKAQ